MAPITLNILIAAVAGQFSDYASGTIGSSSTTGITDPNLIACRKSLIGHQVVVNGVPVARVTTFNDSIGAFGFSPTLGAPPTGTYEILPIPRSEIARAINRAIDAAGTDFMVAKTTELPWTGDYEYAMPDDFVVMLGANYVHVDEVGRRRLTQLSRFELTASQDNRTLVLRDLQPYYTPTLTTTLLQFNYLALPRRLSSGADDIDVDDNTATLTRVDAPVLVEFLTEMALSYLHEREAQLKPGSPASTMHYTAARDCRQKAEQARKRADQPRVQRRVRRSPLHTQR